MDLTKRAQAVIPGGVSSPARAFGYVEGDPIFAASGDGAYLFDTDGNRYIDYIQGFGSSLRGHRPIETPGAFGLSTEPEVQLAELICDAIPAVERVRFVASGTEAGMTAARLARAVTGRRTIIKFEGGYHGHADDFLVKAGSSAAAFATSDVAPSTVVLPYGDVGAVSTALREHEVAAVFVEPVAANMGVIVPPEGFLETIVDGCAQHGALSVFDEVVTGFRLRRGAATDVRPDLTMLGKVIGGGYPIGAIGGRAEIMERLAPLGDVFQAGTYAAHPAAMQAGAQLLESVTDADYERLEAIAAALAGGMPGTVVRARTILCLFFRDQAPRNFTEVGECDRPAFARFHASLRVRGVLIAPSPFEAWFPSLAHTDGDVEATLRAVRAS